MKMKKIITIGLVSLTFGGVVIPSITNTGVYASSNKVYKDRALTASEVKKIDKYITIQNKRYVLSPTNKLSEELKYLAEKHIETTNKLLDQYNGSLFEDTQSKKLLGSTLLDRAPGKNDVEFHWNYVRVYIDAPNIRLAARTGLSLYGVGISSKVVKRVLILLGVGVEVIRDGIWFDYNYFQGGIIGGMSAVMTGQPLFLLAGINNFGFQ